MNLKKAKKLRRLVESLAPESSLRERVYLQHNRNRNIINHPESLRGIYQQLKKKMEGNHVPHPAGTETTPSGT